MTHDEMKVLHEHLREEIDNDPVVAACIAYGRGLSLSPNELLIRIVKELYKDRERRMLQDMKFLQMNTDFRLQLRLPKRETPASGGRPETGVDPTREDDNPPEDS